MPCITLIQAQALDRHKGLKLFRVNLLRITHLFFSLNTRLMFMIDMILHICSTLKQIVILLGIEKNLCIFLNFGLYVITACQQGIYENIST